MNSKKQVAEPSFPQVSSNGGDLEGASEFSKVSPPKARDALQGIVIRRAVKEDCKRMLELVKELAVYEKAPDEVTVTLEHFTDSGFGEKPVWRAFVATSKNGESE